ncbi:ROK family protein [Paenibacillus spongiae]|uniref:ROK family protein n=1 Tax=Paenibacillus spongiae TaxID=2909671 RepID=A0ABY5SA01_9BACL|nr:ROK family protein [Paenibacillus spongiae]UVI30761.1 ROK family protein [Paenibacillus spongiae]
MKRYAFGFDIGGTNIVCGLVDREGEIVWGRKVPTEADKGNDHVMAVVASCVEIGLSESGVAKDDIVGIGIGMPGLVDPERGISVLSSNLHFRNYPVLAKLRELTGMQVCMENDVRMYVYGEAVAGAGRNRRHVFGLTVGTGLATAMVNDGKLYQGGGDFSGELGHVPIEGIEYGCNCGLTGCLETVVSATGLARQAREAVLSGKRTMLADLKEDPEQLKAADVSTAYDAGDEVAIAIMNRTGVTLGKALSYVVPLLSPDIIVLGGGVLHAGERFMKPVRETLFERIMPIYRERLELAAAQRNEDAGVLGSSGWAFRQFGS